MKIRMLGNSVRLRLSQSEVRQILDEGKVSQTVQFSKYLHQQLRYTLIKGTVDKIQAIYDRNQICVKLPVSMADEWATGTQISLEASMPIEENGQLKILVEKDFQCLDERTEEDESDLFPHPEGEDKKC